MKVLSLFSGIGGFDEGLERAGFEIVAHAEIDPFCNEYLASRWPKAVNFGDVQNVTNDTLFASGIGQLDVIVGGFPCQPFSIAGNQQHISDERFLWPEFFRIAANVRPKYLIVENVEALLSVGNGYIFRAILYDLAQIGYDAEWRIISARDLGAWHRRNRLWIVAYPHRQRCKGAWGRDPNKTSGWQYGGGISPKQTEYSQLIKITKSAEGIARRANFTQQEQAPIARIFTPAAERLLGWLRCRNRKTLWGGEPSISRLVNGAYQAHELSAIKAVGNAIVPEVAEFIGKCVMHDCKRIDR